MLHKPQILPFIGFFFVVACASPSDSTPAETEGFLLSDNFEEAVNSETDFTWLPEQYESVDFHYASETDPSNERYEKYKNLSDSNKLSGRVWADNRFIKNRSKLYKEFNSLTEAFFDNEEKVFVAIENIEHTEKLNLYECSSYGENKKNFYINEKFFISCNIFPQSRSFITYNFINEEDSQSFAQKIGPLENVVSDPASDLVAFKIYFYFEKRNKIHIATHYAYPNVNSPLVIDARIINPTDYGSM